MQDFGFDNTRPLDIWRQNTTVIDGHTRFEVAQELGIKHVPVFLHDFEDEESALGYAIESQRNRRNLTDADLARCVAACDQLKQAGRHKKELMPDGIDLSNERSAEVTAKKLGTSPNKINKIRYIHKYGTAKQCKEIEDGTKGINEVYEEIRQFMGVSKKTKADGPKQETPKKFNKTTERIEWASWSWNPVTGCKHDCVYCYAKDIATRFYQQRFKPTFIEERLKAPKAMKVPDSAENNPGDKNVFVCSMADLFGPWVPEEWIQAVLDAVRESPEWNYLFLTKNPKRYLDFEFSKNCWLGTTVDIQSRVSLAEKSFKDLKATVKWLSCEPLLENLKFRNLEVFDWVVIGRCSENSRTPEFQPPWNWIENLLDQAREAKCKVYFKPGLDSRPKEYPGCESVPCEELPREFRRYLGK
jgi:protein gp37